jgi:hypothetical protein
MIKQTLSALSAMAAMSLKAMPEAAGQSNIALAINDPKDARFNYRGGKGTKAHQRAAKKSANVARHRRSSRG